MGALESGWKTVTDGVGQFLMLVTNIAATTRANNSGVVDGRAHDYLQPSKKRGQGAPPPPKKKEVDNESVSSSKLNEDGK